MLLFVSVDYGVLEVTFGGVVCNLVDEASYQCLDKVNYYLHICAPNDYLYYITIDTKTGIVSVYSGDFPIEVFDELTEKPEKPTLKFHARYRLFEGESNLLRLYNMFANHRSKIIVRS